MALTKVTGDFIDAGSITQTHLHSSHGITTSHITEGDKLFFTNARVDSRVGSLSTSNLSEGTNLYYTQARFNTAFTAKSTSDLSEGTNLYYTDARADARVALIVDSAPGTLNTLNELAAALGDDANFSTTVTNSIALKAPLASPSFTGNAIFAGTVTADTLTLTSGNDNLTFTQSGDDWTINNAQQNNGIKIYDGTGGIDLIYNSSAKFSVDSAGVSVNAFNFTVDTTLIVANATDNLVGIGKNPSTYKLDVAGKIASDDYIIAGLGNGGVALTHNDGEGNANVTFNHVSGIPEQNGNSFRIRANTDSSSGAVMRFEMKEGVTADTAVNTIEVFRLESTGPKIRSTSGGILSLQRDDTSIVDGNALGRLRFSGDDPTNEVFNRGVEIRAEAAGTWSTDNYPSELKFYTTATNTDELALTLESSQNATFGGNITQSGSTQKYINGAYLEIGTGASNTAQLTFNADYDGGQTGTYTPNYSGGSSAGMSIIKMSSGGIGGLDFYVKNHGTTGGSHALSTFTKILELNQNSNATFAGTITASGYNDSNWNTAYGWGDHGAAGYLTSFDITTQTDSKYIRSDADDTASGIITLTKNTATGLANNTFSHAKTIIGGIHFANGNGPAANNGNQAAITFQGGSASEAQAGIYVHNNNSQGTHMLFATTDSYSAGPKAGITLLNNGNVTIRGTVGASNFSGSSSGTNTGDQDLSGYATSATTLAGYGITNAIEKGAQIASGASWTTATKFGSTGDLSQAAGNHALSVRSENNNDAFMSFHIGSDYAVHFGLDGATNRMHVGGWSDGTGTQYQLYDSRDFSVASVLNSNVTLATLGYTGATNANYITNNNQLTNGAGYLTSLPSHNHDDRYYTESETQTFFNRGYINSHGASNLAVGWYTIATNTGDRALGQFQIWDTASSDHQSVLFNASHHFGQNTSNDITVTANSRYSGTNFRYIRIKEGSTYDGAVLQVYIDGSSNSVKAAIVGGNAQESGWVLKDWIADGTDPGDVSSYSSMTEKTIVDLDQVINGGMVTTGPIYSGGQTAQYRVLNTSDEGSGNGLDADLLDGNHASAFANVNGSSTTNFDTRAIYPYEWIRMNGNSNHGIYWQNGTGANWHIYPKDQNDMRFRTGSANGGIVGTIANETARGYIHWTTSNEIGFLNSGRSWSLRVDNSGNTFATSSHRAPIFYDSNDTGYYTNPASTSNLNALNVGGSAVWTSGNDGSGSGLDADLLDGVHASSFLRSNADDSFTGKLVVGNTGNRRAGMYGVYDSYKTGHIWSMGSAYQIPQNGADFGNLYGLAYKHTNNSTGGTMASGHQMVWCANGTPKSAMGTNIWTSGNVEASNYYVAGYIYHTGDTNTYIRMVGGDDMQLVAGGRQMLRMDEGGDPDKLRFVTDNDWTNSNGNWAMSGYITVQGAVYSNDGIIYDKDDSSAYYRATGTSTPHGDIFFQSTNSIWFNSQSTSSNYLRLHGGTSSGAYFDFNSTGSTKKMHWRQYGTHTRFTWDYSTAAFLAMGSITANGSDERLKENIVTIDDALNKVKQMRGVYFNRTDIEPDKKRVGFIAQEVKPILPEVVEEAGLIDGYSEFDDDQILTISYANITALIVEAVKEQQTIIDDLKSRLETLENQ